LEGTARRSSLFERKSTREKDYEATEMGRGTYRAIADDHTLDILHAAWGVLDATGVS